MPSTDNIVLEQSLDASSQGEAPEAMYLCACGCGNIKKYDAVFIVRNEEDRQRAVLELSKLIEERTRHNKLN